MDLWQMMGMGMGASAQNQNAYASYGGQLLAHLGAAHKGLSDIEQLIKKRVDDRTFYLVHRITQLEQENLRLRVQIAEARKATGVV